MDIGKRLKQARLEAGLSQRQLCSDIITRNMLSLIENGTARPSMDTLTGLAERLGKPVSYFLEETAVTSPNTERMAEARALFAAGRYGEVAEVLKRYQGPDATFGWEKEYLEALCYMALAEQAIREGRLPYAETLLTQAEEAGAETPYFRQENRHTGLIIRNENAHDEYTTGFTATLFEADGGDDFDVREAVLGPLQQGGIPSPVDRIQAVRMGYFAVCNLLESIATDVYGGFFMGCENGEVRMHPWRKLNRYPDPWQRTGVKRWYSDFFAAIQRLSIDPAVRKMAVTE